MRTRAGLYPSGRGTCLCVAGPLGGASVDQSAAPPPNGLVLRRFVNAGSIAGVRRFSRVRLCCKMLASCCASTTQSYSRHFYDMADGPVIPCCSAYCISCWGVLGWRLLFSTQLLDQVTCCQCNVGLPRLWGVRVCLCFTASGCEVN